MSARLARAEFQRFGASLWAVLIVGSTAIASADASEPDPIDTEVFSAALARADRLFVAGDLEGALRVLDPVCAHSERPECSFSLGAIHHGLGHCSEALARYRRYRAQAPAGEHAADVAVALEEVESRCGEANAVSARVPQGTSAAPSPAASSPPALPLQVASGAPPPVPPAAAAAHTELVVGSLVLSGAAAATSVAFGILAARDARRCDRARTYDRDFIEDCEVSGPRNQRLWQAFALASGGLLGVGLTLWWLDARSTASLGVSGAGYPEFQFQRSF